MTGGDRAHARRVARTILTKTPGQPRKPLAYVLAAVANDPDAYRYRRGNPRRGEWCPVDGHEAYWADNCAGCRFDVEPAALEPEADTEPNTLLED